MPQEAENRPVLDYARSRTRLAMHWPTAAAVAAVGVALNALPLFRTSIPPIGERRISVTMEDMLGWPWVFLWYGGGYSSEVVILWPYLLFDVTLLAGLALATGHAACRITRRSSGPVTIVN